MANYDKHYGIPDLFGKPYPQLVRFFYDYPVKRTVLDVGCGQGRNAILLAKIGYDVTGIDNSRIGIDQMLERAKIENLRINGIVCDLYQFQGFHDFGFILLDSMLHFYKKDFLEETSLIKKICSEIQTDSILCVCIQNVTKKVKILKETISESGIKFTVLHDSKFTHLFSDQDSNQNVESKYCMYIIQKTG
jgi:tellurite methyltransferase